MISVPLWRKNKKAKNFLKTLDSTNPLRDPLSNPRRPRSAETRTARIEKYVAMLIIRGKRIYPAERPKP